MSNSKPVRRSSDEAMLQQGDERNVRARAAGIVNSQVVKCTEIIQRSWRLKFRYNTTYRVMDDFFKNGPVIEYVKSISFEALVALVKEKPIIAVTKAALMRVHLLSIFMHGSPCKYMVPEDVNVRVFLAAYMISYRPTHVFESMGALEQALLEAAIPLLETFERIGRAILGSEGRCFSAISADLTKDFPAMIFEYLKRFKAWKIPDEAKLTCRIKHALNALYQAQEQMPPDEPDDAPLVVEFRTQIERLRSKLQQIAGADELVNFDRQRMSGEVIPPPTGARAAAGALSSTALPGRMTNEQLAHELLLDPGFQLDEHGGTGIENPVFHRIRESFHQAFWDSLVDDLKLASPCYTRVLRVLAEIRDGINDLAGSRESGNISEAVDLDFIRQQAERGLYGWANCAHLIAAIVEIVQRVQAPKRDNETKAKWKDVAKAIDEADVGDQPGAFCKGLEFLLDRVNAMRIDAANARLRLIAPVVKDHGLDYERGKLQDKLNDGSLTLERTADWINAGVKQAVSSGLVTMQDLLDGRSAAFVRVHALASLTLITRGAVPRVENSPETLLFDVYRLSKLHAEFEYIVLTTTMLVTVSHVLMSHSNNLTPEHRMINGQVLGTVCEQFVSESRREIDLDQTVSDIAKMVERSSLNEEQRSSLLRAVRASASKDDAVHTLMRSRMSALFLRIVYEGKVPGDIRMVSSAKPMLPRIDKAASKLRNVVTLNRTVHVSHYNQMILTSAQRLDAETRAAGADTAAPMVV